MALQSAPQTGTRIRERRIDQGLRQADLAQMVGISPSYLNLIEHNRRRIAGRLLGDIARVLEVEAVLLTEGADREVLEQMQAAATLSRTSGAELDRTEDLAGRFPGWSLLIAEQSKRIQQLEGQVQELSDRMAHDPALSASLHSVISSVTSIRSTASILTSGEDLDQDWQKRFHSNIYEDALRLAGNSDALVRYLEKPQETPIGKLPTQEVEAWLEEHLDDVRAMELNGTSAADAVAKANLTPAALDLLHAHLMQALDDADRMPEPAFSKAAKSSGYDPVALADLFDAEFDAILRRLATLSPEKGHPPMGLAVCDASGAILFQKTVPEFGLARAGNACPRWPIFAALSQPMRPIAREVALPGTPETRFMCYAIAKEFGATVHEPPTVRAYMLAISEPAEGAVEPLKVGPTCRICARSDCAARREPSVLGALS